MSFSSDVKTELCFAYDAPRHCRAAQLAAFTIMLGKVSNVDDKMEIEYSSETEAAINSLEGLIKKLFGFSLEIGVDKGHISGNRYFIKVFGDEAMEILKVSKISADNGEMTDKDFNLCIMKSCCKRAFLKGAFLSAGTISDPEKSYHMEINCHDEVIGGRILFLVNSFDMQAKMIQRGKYFTVYLKDSDQIGDLLSLLGATVHRLEMENAKIRHFMREKINRTVNCETANIHKTAEAAAKQIDDIRFIEETVGLGSLANGLDEVARIRLKYPTATLKELGEYMVPPVGKSCINHRLRKLSSIAEKLRGDKEREI